MRPTSVMRTPERMASVLDRDQLRLYTLIWQRTVATQMAEARFNQVGIDVAAVAADPQDGSRRRHLRAARHRPDDDLRRVHPCL